MAGGTGLGGLESLQRLWGQISPTLQTLLAMDFKNLTLKDYVTIIGFVYTAGKSVYALYAMVKVVKIHGVSKVMRPNLKKKYGEWAVVTGCTRGLGRAYVDELAAAGLNIILLARAEEQLKEISEEIASKYRVKTEYVVMDKIDIDDRYTTVQERLEGKEIGILMNNVNVFPDYPQDFIDLSHEDINTLIIGNIIPSTKDITTLMVGNMVPTTKMTHMLLPQMVERGKGAVIIVSSATTDEPIPQLTLFGATKAYLSYFAEALHEEYKDQGITIQCLTPYFISSSDADDSVLVPSSKHYAKSALATLGYSHKTTGCLSHTVQSWVDHLFPHWMRTWMLSQVGNVFKQQASEKLGVELDSVEGPKLPDGSKPFTGSVAAFLEGLTGDG